MPYRPALARNGRHQGSFNSMTGTMYWSHTRLASFDHDAVLTSREQPLAIDIVYLRRLHLILFCLKQIC